MRLPTWFWYCASAGPQTITVPKPGYITRMPLDIIELVTINPKCVNNVHQ